MLTSYDTSGGTRPIRAIERPTLWGEGGPYMQSPQFESKRNGYDPAQVDIWIKQAQSELGQLAADLERARADVQRVQSERFDVNTQHEAIGRALASAHQEAERILAQARAEAITESTKANQLAADELRVTQLRLSEATQRLRVIDEAVETRRAAVLEVLAQMQAALQSGPAGFEQIFGPSQPHASGLSDQLGLAPERASELAHIVGQG